MRKTLNFPRLLEPEARKEFSYFLKVRCLSRLSLCLTFGHRAFRPGQAGAKGENRYFSQRGNCSALGYNQFFTSIQNKPAKPRSTTTKATAAKPSAKPAAKPTSKPGRPAKATKATTKKQPTKSVTAKSTTGTTTTKKAVGRPKSATSVKKATATTKKVQAAKAKPSSTRKSTTSQRGAAKRVRHLPMVLVAIFRVFFR